MVEKKVILVTGASRGIGREICSRLAKDENNVVIGTATSAKGIKEIDGYLADKSNAGCGLEWNALNNESSQLIEQIKEKYGQSPHILVNNAGITRDNLLLRMKKEEWDDVIQANLTACFELTQLCVKGMLKRKWGRIVNISSVVAGIGNPGQANYAAAKAGMVGFTKSLAAEIASRNITVNSICPGFIETEMLDFLTDEQKNLVLEKIPMKRLGQAADIAHAVSYLIDEESGYITGTSLHINGGLVML
ncbi:MAG: beta-ketoacyl-ACP reductase [Pseudomonadota bacterium]|nr:beta-ketoacyl-ACP reductase [Pseudomonadota bacterium]